MGFMNESTEIRIGFGAETEAPAACDRIEKLLQMPYWIIDILPKRVPKDSPGQYFAVEAYFLEEQISVIKQKHVNVILKLNCYMDITIDGEVNPAPDRIAERIHEQYAYILTGDALILSESDETYMTLFNPDEQMLELVKDIAALEGLFVWRGSEEQDK